MKITRGLVLLATLFFSVCTQAEQVQVGSLVFPPASTAAAMTPPLNPIISPSLSTVPNLPNLVSLPFPPNPPARMPPIPNSVNQRPGPVNSVVNPYAGVGYAQGFTAYPANAYDYAYPAYANPYTNAYGYPLYAAPSYQRPSNDLPAPVRLSAPATKTPKAWGDERHIWPDFYTDATNDMWDKMINMPYDMGYMPGGWRFPSFSSPDPVTVGDAVANQIPPIMRESGNMLPFEDLDNIRPF